MSSHRKKNDILSLIKDVPEDTKLYDIPPETFADDAVDKADCYSVSELDDNQIILLTVGLKSRLAEGDVDELMTERILLLAANIKELSENSNRVFLSKYYPTTQTTKLEILNRLVEKRTTQSPEATEDHDESEISEPEVTENDIKDSELKTAESKLLDAKKEGTSVLKALEKAREDLKKISVERERLEKVISDLEASERDLGESVKRLRAERDTAKATARDRIITNLRQKKERRKRLKNIEKAKSGSDKPSTIKTNEKKFGPFVAAYLIRFLVKSLENVDNSWNDMKGMFQRFYSYKAPDWPCPSNECLVTLRDEMTRDRRFIGSWVRIVAAADYSLNPAIGEQGLLRYLAVLPLSYAGMHAYKLFMEITIQSQQDINWLLEQLRCPMTEKVLRQIVTILNTYESTEKEKKTGRFRFARLMGPQYFQDLQTKHCPALVYVLVMWLKKYKVGENVDPSKIVGIQSLAPGVKTIMNKAADELFRMSPGDQKGYYSKIKEQVHKGEDEEASSDRSDDEESSDEEDQKKKKSKKREKREKQISLFPKRRT